MKFSIITPTLNRCGMLAEALASVRDQDWPDVEHIIVDGGSVDGTIEMLARADAVDVIPDEGLGLYAAINLGIARASGDVIALLNSDDLYPRGTLSAVAAAFDACPEAEVICGEAELFDETGVLLRYADAQDLALDAHSALIGSCIPNARFFRTDVFRRLGRFSTDYRIISDREFLVRTLFAGLKTVSLNRLVYRYRKHDGSLTFAESAGSDAALRSELIRLARNVQRDGRANSELRRTARALEGRCLARQFLSHLRSGQITQSLGLLVMREGRLSFHPARAITTLMAELLFPRRSREQTGARRKPD